MDRTFQLFANPLANPEVQVGTRLMSFGSSLQLPAGLYDGAWCGITTTGIAGETLIFGDAVYFKAADSRWWRTDADADATAGDVFVAMCVAGGIAGNLCTFLHYGRIRADSRFPTFTIGGSVALSTALGDVWQQALTSYGTDDVIRKVGFAITADELFFNPDPTYITHI